MVHHEAFEKHDHAGSKPCRICSSAASEGSDHAAIGICKHCWYKILIIVLIVMISISYVAWFGIF